MNKGEKIAPWCQPLNQAGKHAVSVVLWLSASLAIRKSKEARSDCLSATQASIALTYLVCDVDA